MKKNIYFLCIATIILLSGCTKKSQLNDNGCFISLDQASEYAQKKNQDILLIVTTGVDDEQSKLFVENVLNTEEFKKSIATKYSVVNFDFSEESYKKTVVKEEYSQEEAKAADDYAQLMFENARTASLLNVQSAPAAYLFTKEKYFIAEVYLQNEIDSVEKLTDLLSMYEEISSVMNKMVLKTQKGSVVERVNAIDTLFEQTEATYKTFLAPLFSQVAEIDKNNESGLVSKYITAKANAKASEFFLNGQINEAILTFVEATKENHIEPEHVQQLYYMAAYLLASSGSQDFNMMIDYLQKSIDAAPDSPIVQEIANFKSFIEGNIAQ